MFTNVNACYKQMPYMNNYLNSGGSQFKILNNSSFPILFKLSYSVGGVFNDFTSPNIAPNSIYSTEIPAKSISITLTIFDNSDPSNTILLYTIPLFFARNACYRVSGTSSSSTCSEVPCSSLGSSGNTCNNCCCCCCCK
ncbi:hypothetical protein IRP63_15940 (plasmid) [Clostridium botulinum]|uniref:Uncharacterized protein n=1 Tax=Clostridium botulinum C/D str. DC5 TaxID=1443128 RepID=A0A0A0HX99_CLOBO|nr:hypothetical protein [Clostridium botulinum]KEH99948.1 hypothetical protein Z952_14580 [Clostridium botulinum C/D str. BKT75002]KEI05671.1 hypothetical protein Z954_14760 [Clostridium botulinum C/D str. BKT2873]KGM93018.1 hypothetical protein Z955_16330 [Clostridium botulinum C/D str. DC5]KOC51939.1 hypothetical protein ADU90_14995 [Clostridium botulinum]KOC56614.1 hypothetical protein ADU89_02495 [Clostridium botulinum]